MNDFQLAAAPAQIAGPMATPRRESSWYNGWGAGEENITPRRTGWGLDGPSDQRSPRAPNNLFSSLGVPPPAGHEIMTKSQYVPQWEAKCKPGFGVNLLPKRPGPIHAQLGLRKGVAITEAEKDAPEWAPVMAKTYHPAVNDPIHGVIPSKVVKNGPVLWETSSQRGYARTKQLEAEVVASHRRSS